MRVLFNTYPVAFGCPGGGEIQLLRSKQALEALGVEVLLFDPWRPQFESVDVVHYYSVQGGSMNFCDYVKNIGLPLLISPVLWLTEENRGRFPMGEIHDLLVRCDRILPNSQPECDQLAEAFGMNCEIHDSYNALNNVAALQVALAVHNCEWLEVLAFTSADAPSLEHWNYGLATPMTVDGSGYVHAPPGPGLGAQVDWDLINSSVAAVIS